MVSGWIAIPAILIFALAYGALVTAWIAFLR